MTEVSWTDDAKMQEKAKWREEYDRMNELRRKQYEAKKEAVK
jgi:hypothetical protein